jgi:RNA-directed DNA polymerase
VHLNFSRDGEQAERRSRKGGWAIAQSPILNTTITLKRLKQRGYESLLDHYFKVTPHYQSLPLFGY